MHDDETPATPAPKRDRRAATKTASAQEYATSFDAASDLTVEAVSARARAEAAAQGQGRMLQRKAARAALLAANLPITKAGREAAEAQAAHRAAMARKALGRAC